MIQYNMTGELFIYITRDLFVLQLVLIYLLTMHASTYNIETKYMLPDILTCL